MRTLALLALLLLAACGGGGLATRAQGPDAPFGPGRGPGVDALVVGHRLMEAGEHELALRAYLRAAAEHGVNADVLSAIGSANLRLGRLGQAEQMLRRALELDPTFVPALNNLGVVLMEKGETGEARRVFQEAFARDSGATDAIRENLRRAIALTEATGYREENHQFTLLRQGRGHYLILAAQ